MTLKNEKSITERVLEEKLKGGILEFECFKDGSFFITALMPEMPKTIKDIKNVKCPNCGEGIHELAEQGVVLLFSDNDISLAEKFTREECEKETEKLENNFHKANDRWCTAIRETDYWMNSCKQERQKVLDEVLKIIDGWLEGYLSKNYSGCLGIGEIDGIVEDLKKEIRKIIEERCR